VLWTIIPNFLKVDFGIVTEVHDYVTSVKAIKVYSPSF